VVVCLEQDANASYVVQLMPLPPIVYCFITIQTGLPFWSYKEAVKVLLLQID